MLGALKEKIGPVILAGAAALGLVLGSGCQKSVEDCKEDFDGISKESKARMSTVDDCIEAHRIAIQQLGKFSDLLDACEGNVTDPNDNLDSSAWVAFRSVSGELEKKCK